MWSSLRPLFGDRHGTIAVLAVSSVLSGLTEAAILAVLAQAAAALVNGARQADLQIGSLHVHATVGTLLAVALTLATARLALQVPISSLPARIAASVQYELRKQLFDAFTDASWAAQSRDREGHLQEILTSQVLQATYGALQAMVLVTGLCTFLILVASALALNVVVALAVLAACLILFALLRPLNALGSHRARALSQAQMEYANGVGEAIRVAQDTHVFGVASARRHSVDRLASEAQQHYFHTQLLARLTPNVYQSLIYLIIVGGLAGLYLLGSSEMASLGAVVLLLVRAGASGQQVQGSYQYVRQIQPFLERLQEVKQRYADNRPALGSRSLRDIKIVSFEDVSYSYDPGRPALSHVSFAVNAGEAIGVIGPSGSGKSTLVQLLLQLREPHSGMYLVNGVKASELARDHWQALVAYVPQEPRLIHASAAENIRFFRDLDDNAVERAARLARIHDDIVTWPGGYATIIGPRADAISGGQQQRICLARALAAEPQMLVLDEPTSALDPRSEALIHESLAALKGETTLFLVAHRISTLDICDRLMVVVDGSLQAFDTTAALQSSNSYYRFASRSVAAVEQASL